MEKLPKPKCRVCLAENVRMYVVVNKNLHELYERLTDNPLITKDNRPMLACFYCCTKLKQCYRFQRKCLEAEELRKSKPLINQDLECFKRFIQSPMVHVSIVDECQTESHDIKQELPAVCEKSEDIIEPKEERQSDELELENLNNIYSDIEDMPAQQSESSSKDDLPLMEIIKIEVEVKQEVSRKRRGSQQFELENLNNSYSNIEDMPAQQSESGSGDKLPLMEIKKESRKKRRASDTQRVPVAQKPQLHIRRTKLENVITKEQTKNEQSYMEDTQNSQNCTTTTVAKYKEPLTFKPRVSTNEIRIHAGENPLKCDVCQRCFSMKKDLTRHIRIHAGEKPFKCDTCHRCYNQKANLSKHIRIHTGEKPFKCDFCQLCFIQKANLSRHIRTHTGEKPFKCDICQCCFREKCSLTYHLRLHSGEKPFKCEICQRSFRQKVALTYHNRTHTGEKPFKCDMCQRSFGHKIALIYHIRTHTGENPFKCEICKRGFRQKVALTCHIRTHTGEKPFKCDICQRCFSLKGNLTKHSRIHTEKP